MTGEGAAMALRRSSEVSQYGVVAADEQAALRLKHNLTSGLEAYVTLKEHGSRIPGTQWFERRLMSRRQKAGRRN